MTSPPPPHSTKTPSHLSHPPSHLSRTQSHFSTASSCSAQDLSLTAYSFALLGYMPPEAWWARFWASSKARMGQASSQALANMFWALGRLRKVGHGETVTQQRTLQQKIPSGRSCGLCFVMCSISHALPPRPHNTDKCNCAFNASSSCTHPSSTQHIPPCLSPAYFRPHSVRGSSPSRASPTWTPPYPTHQGRPWSIHASSSALPSHHTPAVRTPSDPLFHTRVTSLPSLFPLLAGPPTCMVAVIPRPHGRRPSPCIRPSRGQHPVGCWSAAADDAA